MKDKEFKQAEEINGTSGICEEAAARLADSEKVLVGLGSEWKNADYESLAQCLAGRDYFIITTVTDALIYKSQLEPSRIVAPCGNDTWKQCAHSCTKDIWEEGEVPDGICPHCGAPLVANTILAENYIEEGYLPQWETYKKWLTTTLNRKLTILELGVDFQTPTVIRWPFEKTAFFNQKSHLYRVNQRFPQIAEELAGRATPISQNSVKWIGELSTKVRENHDSHY